MVDLTREQIDRAESRWQGSDYLTEGEATALFAMARAYLDLQASAYVEDEDDRYDRDTTIEARAERDAARSHAKAWKRLAKGLRRDLREACDDYDSSQIYLHNAERDLAAARAALGEVRAVLRDIEWTPDLDGDPYCPSCGRYERRGHTKDCALAAALKEEDHV